MRFQGHKAGLRISQKDKPEVKYHSFAKTDFNDFMISDVDQHFSKQLYWTRNDAAEKSRRLVPSFFKKGQCSLKRFA